MKSKVLSFAEYDQVDISMYKQIFTLDEKAYKKEMDFIKNKNSTWEEAGKLRTERLLYATWNRQIRFLAERT